MTQRPIPEPLYPCAHEACAEERTWPADDLFWSEKVEGWVCDICRCDDPTHEDEQTGSSLSDEIQAQQEQQTAKLQRLREIAECNDPGAIGLRPGEAVKENS